MVAPSDPLRPQQVVVPSLAIHRRLELAYARRFGVCANLQCGFLAQWLWERIGVVVEVPRVSPFSPGLLVWRVCRLLQGEGLARLGRLNGYLVKADPVMRFELAQRITSLFDHYLTYRPEWLAAWSEGRPADIGAREPLHLEDAAWQAELWRQVVAELGLSPFHPAADFLQSAAGLRPDDPRLNALPASAAIFCLPTMPPLYLRLLEELGRWIDLRLYVLNPCRHYWFEIVDPKRLSSLTLAGQGGYHETGSPLLASWGKQTQAHIDLLLSETSAELVVEDSLFTPKDQPTLLAALQNSILDMQPLAAFDLAADDASIAIHACHHLTRQLEVLHDQLLALFGGPQPPRPDQVLVVSPDLSAAAPLIDAVFGTTPPERRIPYTITGRPASQENTIARVFLQLLTITQSRFAVSEIVQLLQETPVARRFNLHAEELRLIQRWLKDSGIRWGLDAEHRQAVSEVAGSSRHTFSDGLQRLFLGYALPDGDEQLVGGILSCPIGEGSQAQILGRLWLFVDMLKELRNDLLLDRTPARWSQVLLAVVDDFFAPDDLMVAQVKEVRAAIAELCAEAGEAGPETMVSLAVLQRALSERLDDPSRGGVPSGRVTFAAMSSLRGLPYRVVCLLGMDDGSFPSAVKPMEFDLMAVQPRRGDLQRRHDERNLFLDLLLAARDRLIITYNGRSIRDNAPLPPSVLVAELLDQLLPAIDNGASLPKPWRSARQRLVVEHPLQAFSRRYFQPPGDPRLFSFDQDYCQAARQAAACKTRLAATGKDVAAVSMPSLDGGGAGLADPLPADEDDGSDRLLDPPFLPGPLPVADEAWRAVRLEQLLRFFRNPCRFLLRERLGLELAEAEAVLEDDEPFVLDWEGWRSLSDRLLPRLLAGEDGQRLEALAAAGHEFPDGRPGELIRRRELLRLHVFSQEVRAASQEVRPESLPFSLDFDLGGEAWRLTGALNGLSPQGLLRYRCDQARATDYLAAWLSHLALAAHQPPGVAVASRVLSLDGAFCLQPVAEPRAILQELLILYRQGLQQPLHFFPKSAWDYVVSHGDRTKAYARFQCTAQRPHGEGGDPYYRLALRGEADPLAGDFTALAWAIYGPLVKHLHDGCLP